MYGPPLSFARPSAPQQQYLRNLVMVHDQVDSCHQQIEKLQGQLLNRDVHRGCNTVSWGGFDKYDHANSEIVSNSCKKQLFPHFKFLHKSWKEYNPTDKGSLYSKINQEIDLPDHVRQNPSEREYFWMNKTVPMINKKYCKIRANITAKITEQYLGKCVIINRGIQYQDLQQKLNIFTPIDLCSYQEWCNHSKLQAYTRFDDKPNTAQVDGHQEQENSVRLCQQAIVKDLRNPFD